VKYLIVVNSINHYCREAIIKEKGVLWRRLKVRDEVGMVTQKDMLELGKREAVRAAIVLDNM
jgi:hypothetical protein